VPDRSPLLVGELAEELQVAGRPAQSVDVAEPHVALTEVGVTGIAERSVSS
jgi:hypothetical protein